MGGSVTISGKNRSLVDGCVTISGKWRKLTGGWAVKNGVWQQIYSTSPAGLALSSLPVGTLIKLNESGSGVNFYLAKHDYESGLNGAGRSLLVRKNAYLSGRGSSGNATTATNAYANNILDTWHNSTYKPMLSAGVQSLIGTTTFYYTPGGATSGSAIQVTTLSRSVFQLSLAELGKSATSYNAEGSALPIASTLLAVTDDSGAKDNQWTRTPSKNSKSLIANVSSSGSISGSNAGGTDNFYRPAFTLPANAVVNPTQNADGSYTLIE